MIETAKGRGACTAKFNNGGPGEQAGARDLATKGPALLMLGFCPIWATRGACLPFFCLLGHQESRQTQIVTPEMFGVPKTIAEKAKVDLSRVFRVTYAAKLPRLALSLTHSRHPRVLHSFILQVFWVIGAIYPFSTWWRVGLALCSCDPGAGSELTATHEGHAHV